MDTTKTPRHKEDMGKRPASSVSSCLGGSKPLPPGWRWVRLGEVCVQDRTIVEARSPDAANLPYLGLEDVESQTGRILKTSPQPDEGDGVSTTFRFTPEHVLYGKLRPYLNKVALPDFAGRCTTEMIPLRCGQQICREFLALILRRPETVEHAMQGKTGSRMPRADMDQLLQLEIPLPPLSEQRRIAGVLREQMAAVERARAAARARLEAVKALPAAFLRQVFPQPAQPLPPGWRWVRLGEVCVGVASRDPGREPDAPFRYIDISSIDTQTKRIVAARTLIGKNAPSRARQVVHARDVLVATTRPNLNAVALVPEELHEAIASTGFCVLRCGPEVMPDYLFHFVQLPDFVHALTELTKGSTYPAVTDGQVLRQAIPLPPLPEQRRIAGILREQMAAVERARAAAEAELEAIEALPAALLRRAFSGEL